MRCSLDFGAVAVQEDNTTEGTGNIGQMGIGEVLEVEGKGVGKELKVGENGVGEEWEIKEKDDDEELEMALEVGAPIRC